MKHISILVKPASSLCNIRCKYCFYADVSSLREVRSFGKMKLETAEKMIVNIYQDLEDGDELTLTFQGGEPTLAGLSYFQQVISFIKQQKKKVTVHYTLQTNGLFINNRWCAFLKEHHFLVGLSIDGFSAHHDLNRIDIKGQGTFQKVLKTKRLFDTYGIEYNILCVLTHTLSKEPEKIFQFIKRKKIRYIQFIPCLDELNALEKNQHSLTPQRFYEFYRQLFHLWLEELSSGNYISIKLFDDVINLFAGGHITACGILGTCRIQYVIEADGSVYPCDFYVLDHYRMGYIQKQTLRELFDQDISKKFLCAREKVQDFCQYCPFFTACRGGCKRMKDVMYVDEQTNFCGYQSLLKTMLPKIEEILQLSKGASR